MASTIDRRLNAAERPAPLGQPGRSVRLDGLDPSAVQPTMDAWARGELTVPIRSLTSMEVSGVYIYLKVGALSDEQRKTLLKRLRERLSMNMTLSEQSGHPRIWHEGPSDDAASVAVQRRLKAICEEFGIPEVTTTLDPAQLQAAPDVTAPGRRQRRSGTRAGPR